MHYAGWIKRQIELNGKRHLEEMGKKGAEAFSMSLVVELRPVIPPRA